MAAARLRPPLLLCLLLAAALSGCTKADIREDREPFLVAFGNPGSGYFARGQAENGSAAFPFPHGAALNGTDARAIDSCLLASYQKEPSPADARGPANPFYRAGADERPPLGDNYGRTEVAALLPGRIPIRINLDQFNASQAWQHGGVRFNFDAFGTNTVAPVPLPTVPVLVASWGRATFEADGAQIPDPVRGFPPRYDPEKDELNWTADFYLLKSGLRDNATKAMHDRAGDPYDPTDPGDARIENGDLEAHLLLYSETGDPKPQTRTFAGPQPFVTERPHARSFSFRNSWFPGQATLVYRVTSSAPDLQLTDLTFRTVDPAGKILSTTRMGGGTQNTETKTVTLPLDQPRVYSILVSGNATLATYDVRATFVGQASLLWFWWEDLQLGKGTTRAFTKCADDLVGGGFTPLPLIADTPNPPGLALVYVILGAAGALLYGLFLTKLAMDQISTNDFKRRFRKR